MKNTFSVIEWNKLEEVHGNKQKEHEQYDT